MPRGLRLLVAVTLVGLVGCTGWRDVTGDPLYRSRWPPNRTYRLTRDVRLAADGRLTWIVEERTYIAPDDRVVPAGTRFRVEKIFRKDEGYAQITRYWARLLDGPLQGEPVELTGLHDGSELKYGPAAVPDE